VVGRVRRVQERLAERAASQRVLAVSHWGFIHFFLGHSLFGEDFQPGLLPALYQAAHANTGITVFEHRDRWMMDGGDYSGWVLKTWNDQAHL
jgi:broad specificity phosphatase PhoE